MIDNKMLQKIATLLKNFGTSPNMSGFHYLKESIFICAKRGRPNIKITVDIYQYISKKYNKSPKAVSRAIYSAIISGLDKCKPEMIEEMFGRIIPHDKDHPTNDQYISTMADYINLNFEKI